MSIATFCTLRALPQHQWVAAAATAGEVNPFNARAMRAMRLAIPDTVIPPEHLAVLVSKYWGRTGVRLTVGFLDNPSTALRTRIVSHMNAWSAFAKVCFVETNADPQVRIARAAGGYWSYHGTDILSISANEATMNLEGFTMDTQDSEFFRVVRHETGHTLGFPHEHKRREIVDRIDRDKAIAHFKATQGWSEQKIIEQVLTPIQESALIATAHADPNSIMCYWLPASIMKDGFEVTGGTDIDPLDAQFAASIYPKLDGPINAALLHPNGKAYFFRGSQYQRFDFTTPEKIDKVGTIGVDGWPGVWSGTDAALVHPNGKAYFFRGNQYQRFTFVAPEKVDKVGTIGVDGWPGVWSGINAALVHPRNGKAYFFRGNQYQRFTFAAPEKVDKVGTVGMDGWPGVWDNLDAALVHPNGKAYFFRGNQYQRFTFDAPERVDKVGTIGVDGWPGL